MTDSTFKKSKHRRNSFDSEFNAQEDFLLADLKVIPDDTNLTIAPLEHLLDEEDAIDRLLVNTGFDTANESMRVDEKFDGFAADALSLINEVAGFEELTGQQANDQAFVVEPVVESTRQTDVAAIPDTNFQIDEFISDYFDKRSHVEVFEPQVTLDSEIEVTALEIDDLIEPRLKVEPLVEELQVFEPGIVPDSDIEVIPLETDDLIEPRLKIEPFVEELEVFESEIAPDSDIEVIPLETDDLIEPRLKIEPLIEELEGAESSVLNSVVPTIDISSSEPEAITKPDAGFQIDDFISNYYDKRPNVESLHAEPSPEPKADDLSDITTRAGTNTAPVEQEADSGKTIAETMTERFSGGAAVFNAGRDILNKLKPAQEESAVNSTGTKAVFVPPDLLTEVEKTNSTVYTKQLKERLKKTEKTTLITYAALAVGVAALISITVLGIMIYDMKTEVAKLSVLLEIIKDDVEAHAVKTSEAK